MKLERARELYSDYVEGTLTPAMRLALEQHLAADAEARADFSEFERVYQLVASHETAEVEVPLGFRAKVLELAAQAQAQRETAPMRRAALSLTGWFAMAGARRRVTGGVLAALVVAALAGIFIYQLGPSNISTTSLGPGPVIERPQMAAMTVIQGVSTQPGPDSNVYHMFHVHLPLNVPKASLTAYVVTATDQITDSDARARLSTPALRQPLELTNNEEMQIPVALLKEAPAGTTLNLLVQWTPDNTALPSGAQVVFTPVSAMPAPPDASPDGSTFYDALQDIAAQHGVTIIADTAAPSVSVKDAPAGSTVLQSLQNAAAQVGYSVQKLDASTYQVYPSPS